MNSSKKAHINGVLLVNKPLHSSSNYILQKVRRKFNAKKAGHTGSLDPLATGMLPICFGDATKFCQFMLDADKSYTATGILGKNTATQDAEGEIVEERSFEHVSEQSLIDALVKFTGDIKQVPSMYSALKKDGVPLYKLARQGIEVERKARAITIHELELVDFKPPFFTINVKFSKGTYIRNLVEDIGNYLSAGAYVDKLHRNYSCPFDGQEMFTLERLDKADNLMGLLHPIESMVGQFPKIDINVSQKECLYYGQEIEVDGKLELGNYYQLFVAQQSFIGLGQYVDEHRLKSKRLIAQF